MSRTLLLTLSGALLLAPALCPAHECTAEGTGEPTVESRLQTLEESQVELYHTLSQKKAAGLASPLTDRLTISGLLEVAATAENLEGAEDVRERTSDLTLATAQLGFGMKLTEEVRGNLSLLYEEDATGLEVDEAAIEINYAPLFARFGRLYVPFGVYPSHFVSDPLTLELGETRETAALFGYGHDLFSLSAFVFNGDVQKSGGKDLLDDWGASLVLTPLEGLELGTSYLVDLADSDAELVGSYHRRVGGWSAFFLLSHGPFGVSGEILGAVKAFAAADLDSDGDVKGDRPLAWNLEAAWTPREDLEVAARYEGSGQFAGRPKRQYGADLSWSPREYTTLSLEYLRGEFDGGFGDGVDTRDLVTAQLGFAF